MPVIDPVMESVGRTHPFGWVLRMEADTILVINTLQKYHTKFVHAGACCKDGELCPMRIVQYKLCYKINSGNDTIFVQTGF